MEGSGYPHPRPGCRGMAHDGAVTSRAEIIRQAVCLVVALSPSRVPSHHPALAWGPTPLHPYRRLIHKLMFVAQYRREAGLAGIFA
jgi:hypothetical protein